MLNNNKKKTIVFLPFLPTIFLSGTFSRSRRAPGFTAVRDELLELDEYDEPVSEPLESEEPKTSWKL